MSSEEIRVLLNEISEAPRFGFDEAKKLCAHDWRSWVQGLDRKGKSEAEEFFYFVEGFVESISEGFVSKDKTAPDLHEMARKLKATLKYK